MHIQWSRMSLNLSLNGTKVVIDDKFYKIHVYTVSQICKFDTKFIEILVWNIALLFMTV